MNDLQSFVDKSLSNLAATIVLINEDAKKISYIRFV